MQLVGRTQRLGRVDELVEINVRLLSLEQFGVKLGLDQIRAIVAALMSLAATR